MKFAIPEISWHNRDPVLSVDFQPKLEKDGPLRLATGGTDTHVLIWYVSTTDGGSVNLEVAADLARHQKAVNVVRWSPSGQYLASGDDESIIFVWKQKHEEPQPVEQGEEQYKESWVIHKTLRGHMEDVLDLSWSINSLHLASGSVDNKLMLWDITRGKYTAILADHKGFVQGVAWDPKGQYIATTSSDRTFRTFDITTKKVTSRSSKGILPVPESHPLHGVRARLYHDDTLQTYYRRLQFSPDGLLVAVPSGRIEPEQPKADLKPINAVYIYSRYCLKTPAVILPCGEPALVARWSPIPYRARAEGPQPALPAPRYVLAVATKRCVLLYDTQQKTPIAVISNIHYTRLTDLSWSSDGQTLVASSTDGYCSVVSFAKGELGEPAPEPVEQSNEPMDTQADETPETPKEKTQTSKEKTQTPKEKTQTPKEKTQEPKTAKTEEPKCTTPKIDTYIKFKAPEKSPKKQKSSPAVKQIKTPVKLDVLVETAMPSWSDNSSNEIFKPKDSMEVDRPIETVVIEDSEDMKLVYEDSQISQPSTGESEKKTVENKEPTPMDTSEAAEVSKTQKSPVKKKRIAPKPVITPSSSKNNENNFFSQAKITDVKQTVAEKAVPSPKAPRRVNFITLSSPKNKKKC